MREGGGTVRPTGSLVPQAFKLGGAQVEVAEDTPERPDFERFIAVNGDGGSAVAKLKEVVTAADANHDKTSGFEKADQLLARRAG